MLSWDALDPFPFKPAGAVTAAFLGLAKADLRAAAEYVCGLPYGRNCDPKDPLIVLVEARGTCSTKHALLHRLALEQGLDLALVLGIYEMTDSNTPGVGAVLRRYGLGSLLEAHCYLRTGGRRIDVTKTSSGPRGGEPLRFLHEEEIDPKQITDYKTRVHRKFLTTWMADNRGPSGFSLEETWAIREACIQSLAESSQAQ
jgi:hypothetical protein